MIDIFYSHFTTPFPHQKWQTYLNTVPQKFQEKINRFRRWQDRQASLLSNLLLQHVLCLANYPKNCLEKIKYGQYHRPFIDEQVDFNLSHSGEYVVCAFTRQGRLGIDIERIRPTQLSDFKNYMTPTQWQDIMVPQPSYEKFYDYWTIKESVMKADGRGLYLPLENINTEGEQAKVGETVWFMTKINIDLEYACHLATSQPAVKICLEKIDF